ncbi:MAG: MFS transporter [Gemmatimonadota bacterium]
MSEYWRFFRSDASLLTYGLSFSFLSSFGQTFLISLFVPFFLLEFALTNSQFAAFYAGATLASAALLPWAGQWMDRAPLHRVTLGVVLLLAASALLLSVSTHLGLFCLALLGLRLAGQGLSSHAAQTAMARYFASARGKALSIAGLGFPAGEALLPFIAAASIAILGWRESWVVVAAVSALVFGPLLVSLLRRSGVELDPRTVGRATPATRQAATNDQADPAPADWRRREVLRDPRFWAVLPAAILPAFWATGFFLYQTNIAEMKGWSLALMASTFTAFAVFRVVTSLAAGGVVDRLSARRIFPVVPLPMALGFGVLFISDAVWTAYLFMGFMGTSMGLAGAASSALWAELYGVRHLGSIKAMLTALMVVSTAAAPLLVGGVMDGFASFELLLVGGIVSVVVASLLAQRALPFRLA